MVVVGGRVLGVMAMGKNIREAQTKAYQVIDCIDWPKGFCRHDIGWRAVAHLNTDELNSMEEAVLIDQGKMCTPDPYEKK